MVAGRNCCHTCSNQQGTWARERCRLKHQTCRQALARVLSCVVESHRPRTSFVVPSRDNFDIVLCLCVTLTHRRRDRHELHIMSLEVFKVLCVATASKFLSILDVARVRQVRQRECLTALAWVPAAERRCPHRVCCELKLLTYHASVEFHESSGKCCLCCMWTPVVNLRLLACHAFVESHEDREKCGICSYQWTTDKPVECHATRRGRAFLECHEYSWSAMSCSTVLTADALTSGSSLSRLLVAHHLINMSSMSALTLPPQ